MTMQRTIHKRLSAAVIMATCFSFSALAQGLPNVSQLEEVGFSSERLNRIAKVYQADVDKGPDSWSGGFDRPATARSLISKRSVFGIVIRKYQ